MLKPLHSVPPAGRRPSTIASQPSPPTIVGKRQRSLTPPLPLSLTPPLPNPTPKPVEIPRPPFKRLRFAAAAQDAETPLLPPSPPLLPPLPETTVQGVDELVETGSEAVIPFAGLTREYSLAVLSSPPLRVLSDSPITPGNHSPNHPLVESAHITRKRSRSLSPPNNQPSPDESQAPVIRRAIPTPRPPAKRTRLELPKSPPLQPIHPQKRFGSTFRPKKHDQSAPVSQEVLLARVMQSQSRDNPSRDAALEVEESVCETAVNNGSHKSETAAGCLAECDPSGTFSEIKKTEMDRNSSAGSSTSLREFSQPLRAAAQRTATDSVMINATPSRLDLQDPLLPHASSQVSAAAYLTPAVLLQPVQSLPAPVVHIGSPIPPTSTAPPKHVASPPAIPQPAEPCPVSVQLESNTLRLPQALSTGVGPFASVISTASPTLAASPTLQPTLQGTSGADPLVKLTSSAPTPAQPAQPPLPMAAPAPPASSGQDPLSTSVAPVRPTQGPQSPPSQVGSMAYSTFARPPTTAPAPPASSGQDPLSMSVAPVRPTQGPQSPSGRVGSMAYSTFARPPTMAPAPSASFGQDPLSTLTAPVQSFQEPQPPPSRVGTATSTGFMTYPTLAKLPMTAPAPPASSGQDSFSMSVAPVQSFQEPQPPPSRVGTAASTGFTAYSTLARPPTTAPAPPASSGQDPLSMSVAPVRPTQGPQSPPGRVGSMAYSTFARPPTTAPAPPASSGQDSFSMSVAPVRPTQGLQSPPSRVGTAASTGFTVYSTLARPPTTAPAPPASSGQDPLSMSVAPVRPTQGPQSPPGRVGSMAYSTFARPPTTAPASPAPSDQPSLLTSAPVWPAQEPHSLSSRVGTAPSGSVAYPTLAGALRIGLPPKVSFDQRLQPTQPPQAKPIQVDSTAPTDFRARSSSTAQPSSNQAPPLPPRPMMALPSSRLAPPLPPRPTTAQPSSSQAPPLPPRPMNASLQSVQLPYMQSSTSTVSPTAYPLQPPTLAMPVDQLRPHQVQQPTPMFSLPAPPIEPSPSLSNSTLQFSSRKMHGNPRTNLSKALQHLQQTPEVLDVGIPLDTSSGSCDAASYSANREFDVPMANGIPLNRDASSSSRNSASYGADYDSDVPMANPSDEDEDEEVQYQNQRKDKGKQRSSRTSQSRDAFETYEHLMNNPNDPCTNAALATVLEVVADVKSDLQHIIRSAMPQAGDSRKGRRGRTPATPKKTFQVQRQDESVTNLQRDVHQLAKELLNMPEALISVPTPEELRLYAANRPDAAGPQIDPFVLDLASKGLSSPWNKRASSIFATEFLSRKEYSCTDRNAIQNAFRTYLSALQIKYKKQQKTATTNEAARIAELDETKRKARYARRTYKRHRRCNALNTFQHVPGVDRLIEELEQLPVDAMSGDETEYGGDEEPYFVKTRCEWRSKEADNLFEVCDALDLSTRFDSNDHPDKGRFPDVRIASNRRDGRPVPPRLPQNLYSADYKETLTASEREDLYMRPTFKFIIPMRLLQIAERYRKSTSRTVPPLPRNHPRLALYTQPAVALAP